MHIALFGATGRVGTRVLEYAIAEQYTVSVLVRDPAKLAARAGLTIVAGDIHDLDAVRRAMSGARAVISTLGGAGLADPGTAQSQGMRNIITVMKELGVQRVLGVAGGGILDSIHGGLRHDQPGFPAMFKPVSDRHAEAWHAMRDSDREWTMVATGDIVPGERTGVYRTLENKLPAGSTSISVEDVADLLLKALRENLHLRTRVGAGY
jgi:putative NADH-flavin reductase